MQWFIEIRSHPSLLPFISNLPTLIPSMSYKISSTASPTTLFEKINEKICLESRYRYSFSISDTFGDGLCCAEGSGSYELKVGEHVIAEGGDFGKSEKFWFTFHDCLQDSDCDDGDYRTISTCKREATACLHRPRPCDEYGQIISINVTTLNFPEATGWKIKDLNGDVQFEGGPYELSKNTYHDNTCLPDGFCTFVNSGDDLFGLKLGVKNDQLLVNDENIWPGKLNNLVIGDPSFAPSTSTSPTSASPTANEISCSCEEDKHPLTIEFMADNSSKLENIIFIETMHSSAWEEKHKLQNFDSSSLNTFNICLDKHSCHRLKITDSESNGICCENGNGWYNAYWKGKAFDLILALKS